MCEVMWGNSFNYTDGGSDVCLTPTNAANNQLVVDTIFDECDDDEADSSAQHGLALGLAAASAAVAMAV